MFNGLIGKIIYKCTTSHNYVKLRVQPTQLQPKATHRYQTCPGAKNSEAVLKSMTCRVFCRVQCLLFFCHKNTKKNRIVTRPKDPKIATLLFRALDKNLTKFGQHWSATCHLPGKSEPPPDRSHLHGTVREAALIFEEHLGQGFKRQTQGVHTI